MIFIVVTILMNFLNDFPFQENLGTAKLRQRKSIKWVDSKRKSPF